MKNLIAASVLVFLGGCAATPDAGSMLLMYGDWGQPQHGLRCRLVEVKPDRWPAYLVVEIQNTSKKAVLLQNELPMGRRTATFSLRVLGTRGAQKVFELPVLMPYLQLVYFYELQPGATVAYRGDLRSTYVIVGRPDGGQQPPLTCQAHVHWESPYGSGLPPRWSSGSIRSAPVVLRHTRVAVRYIQEAIMQPSPLARAKALAEKQWSKKLVSKVERLSSPLLTKYMKRCDVYRVTVDNPAAAKAGRASFPHGLVIQSGKASYIQDDASAAAFITGLKVKVADEKTARDLVMLFAELRDYKLETKQRVIAGARPTKPEDWKFTITKKGKSWTIQCAFMTDPAISSCGQWQFTVDPDGSLSVKFVKHLFAKAYYL